MKVNKIKKRLKNKKVKKVKVKNVKIKNTPRFETRGEILKTDKAKKV